MKVYKYPLHYYSVPELVKLPKGAKILNAGLQPRNTPKTVFWALVDENEKEIEERVFTLAFTGKEILGTIVECYNSFEDEDTGLVFNFLEVTDIKGFDSTKDDRLNNQDTA